MSTVTRKRPKAASVPPFAEILRRHLGCDPASVAIVGDSFPLRAIGDLELAVDDWLQVPGRRREMVGVVTDRHVVRLGALASPPPSERKHGWTADVGPVEYSAVPLADGGSLASVERGLLLLSDGAARLAMLIAGPCGEPHLPPPRQRASRVDVPDGGSGRSDRSAVLATTRCHQHHRVAMRVAPRADPNHTQLERLDLAAHGLAAPFACGESVSVPGPLALRFRDGARFVADADAASPLTATTSLGPLLQRCQQAPFGRGRATRYDRRVRDALQLLAKGDAFTVEGFDPAASGVLEAVRATLAPDDPNALVAELYGVNVYAAGGHFVPHKDTPRGADMLGTLVVCLPVPFHGGELDVTHHGVTKTFAWSNGRRAGPTSGELSWAAFFGDVDHEVKQIWSGHRVTLTWLLRRGKGLPRTVREVLDDPFAEALSVALADPGFLASGGVIGFRCEHLYAEAPGFVRDIPPLDARSVLKLKGRDQQLATAALSAGLDVALKPYVIEPEGQELWRLARFPTAKESGVFRGRQITPYEVKDALPVEAHVLSYNPDTEVHWVGTPLERERHGTTATKLLGGADYSTTGYFGNEGGYAEFYLYAALLVTVPSWARRRPKRATAKTRPSTTKAAPSRVGAAATAPSTGEFMAAELRAMGHSPAAVRRMLAEGTLERAGFGWYRFVPGRPG